MIRKKNISMSKVVAIIIYTIYIIVSIIILYKMFPYFGSTYNTESWIIAGWGEFAPIARYVLFGIYCLCTLIMICMDIIVTKEEDVAGWLSCLWQIIIFVVLLVIDKEYFIDFTVMISNVVSFCALPILIAMTGWKATMGIGQIILMIVITIITAVITLGIEVLVCVLIQKNIACLWLGGDERTAKSKESGSSLKEEIGRAADTYVEIKNAENLHKTAEELEKIRFHLSQK